MCEGVRAAVPYPARSCCGTGYWRSLERLEPVQQGRPPRRLPPAHPDLSDAPSALFDRSLLRLPRDPAWRDRFCDALSGRNPLQLAVPWPWPSPGCPAAQLPTPTAPPPDSEAAVWVGTDQCPESISSRNLCQSAGKTR